MQSTAVAPQALRNGDFTGTGVTIIDPATGLAFGDQSNIGSLPGESPIDPNSVLLMNQMFPLPNEVVAGRFNNFVNPASPVNDTRQDLIRWDHNFNDNHQMMIKYINEETLLANPSVQWSPTTVPTINTLQRTPANLLSGRYIFTISPTLLNEFSVAWSNQNVQAELEGAFTRPAGLTIPQIFGSEDKVPGLTFAGGWAGADLIFFPWFNNAHDLIIQNKVFKQVGNHTLKFGIYLMRAWQFEDTQPINLGGTFNFTGQFSGHPIADFLLGNAATYKEANGQPRGDHTLWNYEGFVQDDWKVTPRLTANLGVRYFYLAPTTEIQDRYSNFVPSAFDPANAPVFLDPVTGQLDSAIPFDSLNGLVRAGDEGVPPGACYPGMWAAGCCPALDWPMTCSETAKRPSGPASAWACAGPRAEKACTGGWKTHRSSPPHRFPGERHR